MEKNLNCDLTNKDFRDKINIMSVLHDIIFFICMFINFVCIKWEELNMDKGIKIKLNNSENNLNPEQIKKDFLDRVKKSGDVQGVFQAVTDIYKDNQNKLSNDIISCMFSILSKCIDGHKNQKVIKTEDLFNLIYDVIKSEKLIDTQTYNHMFDSLVKVEERNLDNSPNENKIEIYFKFAQQFWEKDNDIFNNVLIKYIFDKLNNLNNEGDNNKVGPIKAVDIFNLIRAIQEKKGSTLTEPVISSMFHVLNSAIETGNIENLTTENIFNLIDNILQSVKINDAIGDLLGVLDKLNKRKIKSKETEKTKAINIFESIDYWCRNRITSLGENIILPIFQALESTMMICDLDGLDIEKVISLFSDIWNNNKENILANSININDNVDDIVQHMFGVLLFAIKRGNTEKLKNLRISNLVVLYYGVLKNLKEQNKPIGECILKPMFVALEYALKKCDHSDIELKQITDLVANKDQKFRIATIKSVFNVLFAAIKIKNIDDEQIKKLFEAIGIANIGLSLENNEIVLKSELKNSKEIIDCSEYIDLFNKQLEIIIDTEAKRTSSLNIKDLNQENEEINQKIESQNKQTDKDKKLDQKLLAQQDIDPVDFFRKNNVDTPKITLQMLNDNFKLDIREQDVKIDFWEYTKAIKKLINIIKK